MQNFREIVVLLSYDAINAEEFSLKQAVKLAKANDGHIHVVCSLAEAEMPTGQIATLISQDEFRDLMRSRSENKLTKLIESFSDHGVQFSGEYTVGRPSIEGIKCALKRDAGLIIKSISDRRLSAEELQLLRNSPCPVWMVGQQDSPGKIVATVDVKVNDDAQNSRLNSEILEVANYLAKHSNTQVTLLHCWHLVGESALKHSGLIRVSDDDVERIMREERAQREKALGKLAEEWSIDKDNIVLMKGDAKVLIPKYVSDNDVSTLVMGTAGRAGIPGKLIGNTAETVLREIETCVLAIKPQGFESPVS